MRIADKDWYGRLRVDIPWYYGAAYSNVNVQVRYYYPIPINLFVRLWRRWQAWRLVCPKWIEYSKVGEHSAKVLHEHFVGGFKEGQRNPLVDIDKENERWEREREREKLSGD